MVCWWVDFGIIAGEWERVVRMVVCRSGGGKRLGTGRMLCADSGRKVVCAGSAKESAETVQCGGDGEVMHRQ